MNLKIQNGREARLNLEKFGSTKQFFLFGFNNDK